MKTKRAGAARPGAQKTNKTGKRKEVQTHTGTAKARASKTPVAIGKPRSASKRRPNQKSKKAAQPREAAYPQVFYRVNALLHSMRAIERHEEQLCIIMTDIQRSGVVSVDLAEELSQLLGEIPSSEYQRDLDAVREALVPSPFAGTTNAVNKVRASKGARARSRK